MWLQDNPGARGVTGPKLAKATRTSRATADRQLKEWAEQGVVRFTGVRYDQGQRGRGTPMYIVVGTAGASSPPRAATSTPADLPGFDALARAISLASARQMGAEDGYQEGAQDAFAQMDAAVHKLASVREFAAAA